MSINVSSAQDYIASGTNRKELNFFLLTNKGFMLSYTPNTKSTFRPSPIVFPIKPSCFLSLIVSSHSITVGIEGWLP